MSKASALGAGTSFQQTQNISSRRAAINAATKAPTEGTPPPVNVPVGLISLNPANPRSDLGDLTDLANSMRDHGQKTAISIMEVFSYLEANPEKKDELEPGTKYVAIDGNSRLAAAREAGLATVKVMLDDELGSNPDELLESALVANIHRQDLDHLDEAVALKQLLKRHGTQEALAARLHRSQGWVSQRLALLGLTPDLKKRLESGEEPADLLRRVGKKKPEEQEEHLRRLKQQREEEAAAKKTRTAKPAPKKAPKTNPADKERGEGGAAGSDTKTTTQQENGAPVPHDNPPGGQGEQPADRTNDSPRLPSLDPEQLAKMINEQMERQSRKRLIALLLQYNDAEATDPT